MTHVFEMKKKSHFQAVLNYLISRLSGMTKSPKDCFSLRLFLYLEVKSCFPNALRISFN